jgi:hypothetical protein
MTLKEGVMDTLEIVTGVKQGEVHSPFKPIVHLLACIELWDEECRGKGFLVIGRFCTQYYSESHA